ncbi:hypothetical protein PILCRDRAFT_798649 [Piloderma croceum F 1598]|uniref:CxC5 like cysteine cluster associated with KDZ domain-containing protein n=1 Tax=Piloderma croceum (strain F 1598) TaxID=765440 RepID=A0A0C3APH8_PILCF|nr:hypothetical protein PILCRDRAFT_798649 [Piloderma croceum F 1598]
MANLDTFDAIYELLKQYPGLSGKIGMEKGMTFVRLATHLKDEILMQQRPSYNLEEPPDRLPENVSEFLGNAMNIPDEYIEGCWNVFRQLVWHQDANGDSVGADVKFFRQYGLQNLLSACTLFPPTRTCTNIDCPKQHTGTLLRRKDDPRKAVLFTLGEGACPTYSIHLYCYECHTSYEHCYSVKNNTRTYYKGIPDVIEVGEHQFVEREVLNLFTGLMLLLWTSATNGAHVYNTCLSQPENQPDAWQFGFELRPEQVWDGFCLLSLLEDHARHHTTLAVPDDGAQKDRFTEAMKARKLRMQQAGQEEYAHACNKCVRVWEGVDGQPSYKCSVLVIDGITISHPCCGILHCQTSLASNRHCYCPSHDGHHHICAVEGCLQPVASRSSPDDSARLTCDIETHAALEKQHKQRVDSDAAQPTAEEVEEMEFDGNTDSACPNKPEVGNHKICALFGRRHTHNKQIMVRPCGIIVAWQTFFGSETTPQTVDMIHKVFRIEHSMPNIIFYDNNCGLYRHLVAVGDNLYKTVGLPVDVFHWQCKHRKSDIECSVHCRPPRCARREHIR